MRIYYAWILCMGVCAYHADLWSQMSDCSFVSGRDTIEACKGEGTFYLDNPISEGGDYQILISTRGGVCDTFVALHVIELSPESDTLVLHLNDGSEITIRNRTYSESGIFRIQDIGSNGCQRITTIIITEDLILQPALSIPNIFSPASGIGNSTWRIQLTDAISAAYRIRQVTIYNRWGAIAYIAINQDEYIWDGVSNGAPAMAGVYAVYIEVIHDSGIVFHYVEDLTLLR